MRNVLLIILFSTTSTTISVAQQPAVISVDGASILPLPL